MTDHRWAYIFLRTDLPTAQQAIQAAHACLELGRKLEGHHPSLVFIQTRNIIELEHALIECEMQGIKTYPFFESYCDWGLTAFACEPMNVDKRHIFTKYKLWRK